MLKLCCSLRTLLLPEILLPIAYVWNCSTLADLSKVNVVVDSSQFHEVANTCWQNGSVVTKWSVPTFLCQCWIYSHPIESRDRLDLVQYGIFPEMNWYWILLGSLWSTDQVKRKIDYGDWSFSQDGVIYVTSTLHLVLQHSGTFLALWHLRLWLLYWHCKSVVGLPISIICCVQ